MKWLLKLLRGNFQTKQQKRNAETAEYVHGKKNEFQADMAKLHRQSKRLHQKALQTQVESVKLNRMVEDITSRIAVATGGAPRGK